MENMELKGFQEFYKNKKIFITGATGFKGSWLALWLHFLGAKVYSLSLPAKSAKDNFQICGLTNYIENHTENVKNIEALKKIINTIQPEIVFHLAAQSLVLESYHNPLENHETNVMGTVNILESIRSCHSVKVAVMVTSDKCYENKEWLWGYRENDALGGKDPYSASKACQEIITHSYLHSFFNSTESCAIASARAGNVIGGGDWAADRIIPDFYRATEEGKPLLIRNPLATRPWQHVLEPLSGYMFLAQKLWQDKLKFQGSWNFGPDSHNNYSVQNLIQSIIDYSKKGDYTTPDLSGKLHEANYLKLDISKALNILKWSPVLDYTNTIRFTCDGYEAQYNKSDILNNRQLQIAEYTSLAKEMKIEWAL
jgi:CDP-glucose 4,6-dehydratase